MVVSLMNLGTGLKVQSILLSKRGGERSRDQAERIGPPL